MDHGCGNSKFRELHRYRWNAARCEGRIGQKLTVDMHGAAVVMSREESVKCRDTLVVRELDAAEGRGVNNGPIVAFILVG